MLSSLAPLLGLCLVLGGCRGTGPEVQPRAGSVGAGSSSELERMIEVQQGGVVAQVLPAQDPGRPDRVVLAMRVRASTALVRRALLEVERYPETVEQVAGVELQEQTDRRIVFEVELELPFQNLFYGLEYDLREASRVDVRGVSGALTGGRWCWEFVELERGSLVIYTSESDLNESAGFVLRQLLELNPDLQEGMAFAQGLRFLRAVGRRAEALAGGSE